MTAVAKEVPCNLCGANDARSLFEAGVAQMGRIVKCRQCGLMYIFPVRQDQAQFQQAPQPAISSAGAGRRLNH